MPSADHYAGLFAAYGLLVVLTLLIHRVSRRSRRIETIWPAQDPVSLRHPWADVGFFVVAVAGVIGVGRLYQRGMLLPTPDSPAGAVSEAFNQFLIFAPIPLLLVMRRQGPETALLSPKRRPVRRLGAAVGLAAVAMLTYAAVTEHTLADVAGAFADEARSGRLPAHAVQVFMEDLAIGVLLVRLAAAVRSEWAAGVAVATLFAAAHIPAMLSGAAEGLEPAALTHLGLDALIGVIVMVGLLKTRDVLWLFPTHLTLDVMQFAG